MTKQQATDFVMNRATDIYRQGYLRGLDDGRWEVLRFALDVCLETKFGAAGTAYAEELFSKPREEQEDMYVVLGAMLHIHSLEELRNWWNNQLSMPKPSHTRNSKELQ